MIFTQPPIKAALVQHGKCDHWHEVTASHETKGLTLDDMARSAVRLYGNLWGVWGEDGFAKLPVPEDSEKPAKSTANEILAEMAKEPAEEAYE